MAQVYFHCSGPGRVLVDHSGADVGDLTEAREYAARVVQSLIATPSPEDWRLWSLQISDDLGDEVFVVPFVSNLSEPH
jgi:Domain of unknown function (DUF6894)